MAALLFMTACERDRLLVVPPGTEDGATADGDGGPTAAGDGGPGVYRGPRFTFAIADGIELTNARPWGLAAGDFNRDGRADLILGSAADSPRPASIDLLLGTAAGTVMPAGHLELAGRASQSVLVTGDFDGDGNLDGSTTQDSDLLLVRGDGQGGIAARTLGKETLIGSGDFNGDQRADLVISWPLEVLLADGAGSFRSVEVPPAPGGPLGVTRAASSDFNGDGTSDLVCTRGNDPPQVLLYHGGPDGKLSFRSTHYVGILGPANSLALADLNQDRKLDVVVRSYERLYVLFGSGVGELASPVPLSVHVPASGPVAGPMLLADLNGDSLVDLVLVKEEKEILLWPGTGDGRFEEPEVVALAAAVIVAADIDGDGRLDLASAVTRRIVVGQYWTNRVFVTVLRNLR